MNNKSFQDVLRDEFDVDLNIDGCDHAIAFVGRLNRLICASEIDPEFCASLYLSILRDRDMTFRYYTSRFDYCPKCGSRIDWDRIETILNGGER
jgi:hypothetical protein